MYNIDNDIFLYVSDFYGDREEEIRDLLVTNFIANRSIYRLITTILDSFGFLE